MGSDSPKNFRLAETTAWAEANSELLEITFERFCTDGNWPTLEELQHDFELRGIDISVSRLGFEMPRALGFVDQQHLVLLVYALSYVDAAQSLLNDWGEVLRLAYRKWLRDPSDSLNRAEVFELLGNDPERTWLVSLLLHRERWPFGSGHGGPEDEWTAEIISDIRIVRNAHTAADILAARLNVEFPEPVISDASVLSDEEKALPSRRITSIREIWRLVSYNPLWSALIATIVGGLIVALIVK